MFGRSLLTLIKQETTRIFRAKYCNYLLLIAAQLICKKGLLEDSALQLVTLSPHVEE
jgi:hypothetical protein